MFADQGFVKRSPEFVHEYLGLPNNHRFSLRRAACSLRKYVGSSSPRRLLPIVSEKKIAAAIGRWWIATGTIAPVGSRVSTVTPLNCTPACASATHSRYCLAPTVAVSVNSNYL